MADGIRPAHLFRGITGRLRVFLVRGEEFNDYADSPPAFRLLYPAICLSGRGRNHRAGYWGRDEADPSSGRRFKRASKIAKAILMFEAKSSRATGSVFTGTVIRYGSIPRQTVMNSFGLVWAVEM